MGGAERMKTFPALKPVDMQVTGMGWKESAADILFSSAGNSFYPIISYKILHIQIPPTGYVGLI